MSATFRVRHMTRAGRIRQIKVDVDNFRFREGGFIQIRENECTEYIIHASQVCWIERVNGDETVEEERLFDMQFARDDSL